MPQIQARIAINGTPYQAEMAKKNADLMPPIIIFKT